MHTCNLVMLQIIIYTGFDKKSMNFTFTFTMNFYFSCYNLPPLSTIDITPLKS